MDPLILSNYTLTTAAGCGNQENLRALIDKKSGLRPNNFLDVDLETWIGRVDDVEKIELPAKLKNYQCRNNQLACMALQNDNFSSIIEKAKLKYGCERLGIFLGTSTSGILTTELAYRDLLYSAGDSLLQQSSQQELKRKLSFKDPASIHFREQHNSFSLADFVQQYFKLKGPAQVISTACSSSAKVFASASNYISMGLCDAAIVGGVDSLCLTTLYGFNSLELLARDICRPADENRKGLSIGEAAAFILLEKPESYINNTHNTNIPVSLLGYGESSDAYHMSSPQPQGLGAIRAMQSALCCANRRTDQIDYINLHGTATTLNDSVEDIAVSHLFSTQTFPNQTHCSSTKGWTGHTLGASGATEAVYSALCIENNLLPVSLNTLKLDPNFKSNIIVDDNRFTIHESAKQIHTIASNSFGFGGNNCCLIFGDNIISGKQKC